MSTLIRGKTRARVLKDFPGSNLRTGDVLFYDHSESGRPYWNNGANTVWFALADSFEILHDDLPAPQAGDVFTCPRADGEWVWMGPAQVLCEQCTFVRHATVPAKCVCGPGNAKCLAHYYGIAPEPPKPAARVDPYAAHRLRLQERGIEYSSSIVEMLQIKPPRQPYVAAIDEWDLLPDA